MANNGGIGARSRNSSVPGSTELSLRTEFIPGVSAARSLKCVSHSCWLRRLLLHRRECNFIRPEAAFRLREKNSQRRHAARVRALLRTRCCWKSANWRGVCLIYVTHVLRAYTRESRDRAVYLGNVDTASMILFEKYKLRRTDTNFRNQFKSKRMDWRSIDA